MTALVANRPLPVRALGGLLRAPIVLAARAGAEAHDIWHDARAVGRRNHPEEERTGPLTATEISIAWYVGLFAMAVLRVVNWRTAIVLAVAHTIERTARNRAIAELVEGIEAGL
jgi:hypothetical protein